MCLLSILRVVRDKFGRSPYLSKIQVMLVMTYKSFTLDVLCEMNGRQSRYIKEVLDWYREGDTGDLKRSELGEVVGGVTCLNWIEDGESQWRNLERKFGSARSERMASVHLQVEWLKESS